MRDHDLRRFLSHVIGSTASDCMLWTGAIKKGKNGAGYGVFSIKEKRSYLAHRASYEHFIGPIPEGLQIDHLCRNRACVNPSHLEAVTCRINILRGQGTAARNATRTHCPKGHPYSGHNLFIRARNGSRECRLCMYLRKALNS